MERIVLDQFDVYGSLLHIPIYIIHEQRSIISEYLKMSVSQFSYRYPQYFESYPPPYAQVAQWRNLRRILANSKFSCILDGFLIILNLSSVVFIIHHFTATTT